MRFYFLTAGLAAVALTALGATAPRAASAIPACGGGAGQKCTEECQRECSNGSCCSWEFTWWIVDAE